MTWRRQWYAALANSVVTNNANNVGNWHVMYDGLIRRSQRITSVMANVS